MAMKMAEMAMALMAANTRPEVSVCANMIKIPCFKYVGEPFSPAVQNIAQGVPNQKNGGIARFFGLRHHNDPFINPEG